MVWEGETETLFPTGPTPLSTERDGAGLPEMDQERVDDWPWVIVDGEKMKEEMVGAVLVEPPPPPLSLVSADLKAFIDPTP